MAGCSRSEETVKTLTTKKSPRRSRCPAQAPEPMTTADGTVPARAFSRSANESSSRPILRSAKPKSLPASCCSTVLISPKRIRNRTGTASQSGNHRQHRIPKSFESSCLPNVRRRSRWLKILPNDCPRKPFCLFALSRTVLFRAPWIFFVLWENHGSRFSDKRVTMAVCPADKRYGFYAFFEVFSKKLRIDTHNQTAMSSFFRLCFPIPRHLPNHRYRSMLITRRLHKDDSNVCG